MSRRFRILLAVSCCACGALGLGCRSELVTLGSGARDRDAGADAMAGSSGAAPLGGTGGGAGAPAEAGSPNGGTAGTMGITRFGDASPVAELNTDGIDDNVTLTGDLLEIYFTSDRAAGNIDVWYATRTLATEEFGTPLRLAEASSDGIDTSPAVSLDGLTLWVGQDRPGGAGEYDIWAIERPTRNAPWSSLFNVTELNSPQEDIPRPPGQGNRVMPLGSRRSLDGYRTYLARRTTPDAPFGEPALVSELAFPGQSTVDGFLTEDGLTLFYSGASSEDGGDLFMATRPNDVAPFADPIPIMALNTSADERDPWMSPDGSLFFFVSNREGMDRDVFLSIVTRE